MEGTKDRRGFSDKSRRIEEAYIKMGCVPTWSCALINVSILPLWSTYCLSESNAVNYINSVVGARTARYPDLIELCCAVVGRVQNLIYI